MSRITNLILEIAEKFVEYNNDLKKGNFLPIRSDINEIFLKYEKDIEKSLNLTKSEKYGINIEIVGLTSSFLFPASLYFNDFRLRLLTELKYFMKKNNSPEELFEFLSRRITSTIGVKRGGFTKNTIIVLRFFFRAYSKVLDNKIKFPKIR